MSVWGELAIITILIYVAIILTYIWLNTEKLKETVK